MDNKGKAAALVGLSAIGGILAYYGYSQYGNEVSDSEPTSIIVEKNNELIEVPETISDTVSKYLTKMTGVENVKLEVSENDTTKQNIKESGKTVFKKAMGEVVEDDTKTWSKYWTDEYNKQSSEGKNDDVSDANLN